MSFVGVMTHIIQLRTLLILKVLCSKNPPYHLNRGDFGGGVKGPDPSAVLSSAVSPWNNILSSVEAKIMHNVLNNAVSWEIKNSHTSPMVLHGVATDTIT